MGDRVTVEEALPEGVTAEDVESIRAWAKASVNSTMFCGFFEDRQAAARYLLAVLPPAEEPDWATCSEHCVLHNPPAPSEPPRPELPPARKGWVLTGEWGDPVDEGWSHYAAAFDGIAIETADERPARLDDDRCPFGRGTFRFRLLKVPAPPGPGWVVTKYEEPQKGAMVACTTSGDWRDWLHNGPAIVGPHAGYPAGGKRFIAEQEDRDDDRTRLAKAVWEHSSAGRYVHGPWGEAAPNNRTSSLLMADGLLARGVKAPDPVRLESL